MRNLYNEASRRAVKAENFANLLSSIVFYCNWRHTLPIRENGAGFYSPLNGEVHGVSALSFSLPERNHDTIFE